MELTIELGKKATGYKDALIELISSPFAKEIGIRCELGPIPTADLTKKEIFNRVRVVDHKRVCATLTDAIVTDTEVTFKLNPSGPLAKELKTLLHSGVQFNPVCRARYNTEGTLLNMYGIDLNPIYQKEVVQ